MKNQQQQNKKKLSNKKYLKRNLDDSQLKDIELDIKNLNENQHIDLFENLPISNQTKHSLKLSSFTHLTSIQSSTLPVTLKGFDVLGAARTGSGKTLAFLIPLLEKLYRSKWSASDGLGGLVIVPTRELAVQIFTVLRSIGQKHTFSAGLIIGGKNVKDEKARLLRMNILVATPGRLLQHMDETYGFNADNLQMLILDEADRTLDMGFKRTIEAILEQLPPSHSRQNLLFSATQSPSVASLAKISLNDPKFIQVGQQGTTDPTPKNLSQFYSVVPLHRKLDVLFGFIRTHLKNKILVFVSSCKQVRHIYETFSHIRPGISLLHLHGKQKQAKRNTTLSRFSSSPTAVLFATDIAARGLDIPQVDWVVQVDIPEDADTYIHRVGRTARYESKGSSLTLVEPSEEKGILKRLEEKKITVNHIKIKESMMQPIQNSLQAYAFQDPEIKYLAQKAFVSYLRSIYLQKDKAIFNLTALPIKEYAESLGLPGVPKIKFLSAEKNRLKKQQNTESIKPKKSEINEANDDNDSEEGFDLENASSSSSDESEEGKDSNKNENNKNQVRTKYDRLFERKNQGQLSSHYNALIDRDNDKVNDDDDDDFITLKRANHDLEGGGDDDVLNTKEDLSKRKLKAGTSKKAIASKSESGTKLKFDDEGNPHQLYEFETAPDRNAIENERVTFVKSQIDNLKQADVSDKALAKSKRQEKKRKRKEREQEINNDDEVQEAVIGGDDEDDGYVSPEFDISSEDDENESDNEGTDDEQPSAKRPKANIDDDEDYALRLLRGGN